MSPARRSSADGPEWLVDEELIMMAAKRDTCRMQRLDGMRIDGVEGVGGGGQSEGAGDVSAGGRQQKTLGPSGYVALFGRLAR